MKLNELLQIIDLTESTVNVFKDGEKVDIDIMSDNDYPVERIFAGNYEINIDIKGE